MNFIDFDEFDLHSTPETFGKMTAASLSHIISIDGGALVAL